jgi:hypothetical protein
MEFFSEGRKMVHSFAVLQNSQNANLFPFRYKQFVLARSLSKQQSLTHSLYKQFVLARSLSKQQSLTHSLYKQFVLARSLFIMNIRERERDLYLF